MELGGRLGRELRARHLRHGGERLQASGHAGSRHCKTGDGAADPHGELRRRCGTPRKLILAMLWGYVRAALGILMSNVK
jgi:hypothetical protein